MFKDFTKGLWAENPTFRLLIGLCPVLGVTTSVVNGVSMGVATTFVLVCSSLIISLLKKVIPSGVRIPAYIVLISTFVTIVELVMKAFMPDIHSVLGVFIPLIAVNCIVLGRAEAYASKMPVIWSGFDALGMGLGFTWALVLLSSIRELLGEGKLLGYSVLGDGFTPWKIMGQAPGAFITLGLLLGLMNLIPIMINKFKSKSSKAE